MIILPTRRKLLRRRDLLYRHLISISQCATVHQVEEIMRQINCINLKLRTYFIREYEPKEVFLDDEENSIKEENPFTIEGVCID